MSPRTSRAEPQARPGVLGLLAIAVLVTAGGIGTAASAGFGGAPNRAAVSSEVDDAEAHFKLGNALKDQGKLEEAIAAYREAIRLKPDFADAHKNLGNALANQEKLEEAITEYRKARDDAEPGSNLARLIARALNSTGH